MAYVNMFNGISRYADQCVLEYWESQGMFQNPEVFWYCSLLKHAVMFDNVDAVVWVLKKRGHMLAVGPSNFKLRNADDDIREVIGMQNTVELITFLMKQSRSYRVHLLLSQYLYKMCLQ